MTPAGDILSSGENITIAAARSDCDICLKSGHVRLLSVSKRHVRVVGRGEEARGGQQRGGQQRGREQGRSGAGGHPVLAACSVQHRLS